MSAQKCPYSSIGEEYQPFEQVGMADHFRRARAEEPVFYNPELDCWVVTKRADVVAVFKDPDTYSASNSQDSVVPFPEAVQQYLADGGYRREPTQANCDAPKHTRIRKIASRFFSPRRFRVLEPQIRAIMDEYVTRLKARDQVDLVGELAYELPARVIFLLLGVPDIDVRQIKYWSDNRFAMVWGRLDPADAEGAGEQLLDYWNYCKALVADRQENPGDDYASGLLKIRNGDDDIISVNEIVNLVFGILLAGHETTTNGIASMLYELLLDERRWAQVCEGQTPLRNVVDESLRYSPPFVTWRRRCTTDVEISGVPIPKNSTIMLALASANRDEEIFDEPEQFDIDRNRPSMHVSFGLGAHFCMGAELARMEMEIVLEELVKTFPNMSMVPDQDFQWAKTISPRGLDKLMVNLNNAEPPSNTR
ncbi:cytochrome P450 [Rhodococcus sp. H29-C3]|uniref:cytochrome P450 n=1 Tax=Rhodococcus sp. H29-C3 TaxID=3046307 RepID=UPI0024BB9D50|nr:cytochrome P450 [Rhodococcus sp. H29-C3]MDJ0361881.1 cytochrome P450 [Rhodococcus sp. H29-C3]